jgi:hypothetical protein
VIGVPSTSVEAFASNWDMLAAGASTLARTTIPAILCAVPNGSP